MKHHEIAIEGLEMLRRSLAEKLKQTDESLTELKGSPVKVVKVVPYGAGPIERVVSAAGREAMAAAQRRRWAAKKAEQPGVEATPISEAKPKRKMSAAGRKAIAAGQRKRQEKRRQEEAAALAAAQKGNRKAARAMHA